MQQEFDLKARQNARKYAVQALYQRDMTHHDIQEIEAQFISNSANKRVEQAYLIELIREISKHTSELDACFTPFLSRDISDIDSIELAILRLATYELKHRIDVPYQVVLNEALTLTKTFGATDGFKFINGVLDKTAAVLRSIEKNA